ncbi:hypothetical protein F4780DRAFT_787414 [Xylariomycetidae sp. FL0641]|nr:hypothetical protein F4780DRAFT_787414 [Xylariomycetidae sp. FL0641]
MNCFIAGRALAGIAAGFLSQGIWTASITFSHPHELRLLQSSLGVAYSLGLFIGPLVGGAFATNAHATTWRWSFYVLLPFLASTLGLLTHALPRRRPLSSTPPATTLDWAGTLLHAATLALLGSATALSGAAYPWSAGAAIALWILSAVAAVAYALQQVLSAPGLPGDRAASALPSLVSTAAAAGAKGVVLYYLPLYFAFVRGDRDAWQTATRLLPFLAAYLAANLAAAGVLAVTRRRGALPLLHGLGGALVLVGGGLLHALGPATPAGAVTGAAVPVGLGVGLVFHLPPAIPPPPPSPDPDPDPDEQPGHATAQFGGLAVALAIAGAVYQNVGVRLVTAAVDFTGYAAGDLRSLLAGAACPFLVVGRDGRVLPLVLRALARTIDRCAYLVIAAGAVGLLAAAVVMGWGGRRDGMGMRKRPLSSRASGRVELRLEAGGGK